MNTRSEARSALSSLLLWEHYPPRRRKRLQRSRAGEAIDAANEARRIAIRDQEQLFERLTAQLNVQNSTTDIDRLSNQLALDQLV